VFRSQGFIICNSLASIAGWRVPNSFYGYSSMPFDAAQMASSHTDILPSNSSSIHVHLQIHFADEKTKDQVNLITPIAQECHKGSSKIIKKAW
jgi:hypothetical protein